MRLAELRRRHWLNQLLECRRCLIFFIQSFWHLIEKLSNVLSSLWADLYEWISVNLVHVYFALLCRDFPNRLKIQFGPNQEHQSLFMRMLSYFLHPTIKLIIGLLLINRIDEQDRRYSFVERPYYRFIGLLPNLFTDNKKSTVSHICSLMLVFSFICTVLVKNSTPVVTW